MVHGPVHVHVRGLLPVDQMPSKRGPGKSEFELTCRSKMPNISFGVLGLAFFLTTEKEIGSFRDSLSWMTRPRQCFTGLVCVGNVLDCILTIDYNEKTD